MHELWRQNLTRNGSRTWKDYHLASSTCTSPLNVAYWIEFCWRASITPRYKQQTTLQGLLLRFGWDESHLGALRSTPLQDVGTYALASVIEDVVPKARLPLDFSGSAQLTTSQIIRMGDGGARQGISTDIQNEVTLLSFLPGVLKLSPWGLPWAGLCIKVFFFLPERSPWITTEMWLSSYWHASSQPLRSFPHTVRSNTAWDWFVQRAKQPKRLGTVEFTLNLGGGKMSRAGTKGIQ